MSAAAPKKVERVEIRTFVDYATKNYAAKKISDEKKRQEFPDGCKFLAETCDANTNGYLERDVKATERLTEMDAFGMILRNYNPELSKLWEKYTTVPAKKKRKSKSKSAAKSKSKTKTKSKSKTKRGGAQASPEAGAKTTTENKASPKRKTRIDS